MKKVLTVLLIAVAVAYYFGYDLSDFIPFLPGNSGPPPKARRAPPAEQTQNAAPAPTPSNGNSNVIADSSDGSLANRWQSLPSASPKKP